MKLRILFFVLISIFFIFPVFVILILSFTNMWIFPHVIPETFSLGNIHFLFDNSQNIIISILSLLSYSPITALLTFLITVFPASVFARHDFKFKHLAESFLLIPALIPSMSFSMGLHYIFLKIGLSR